MPLARETHGDASMVTAEIAVLLADAHRVVLSDVVDLAEEHDTDMILALNEAVEALDSFDRKISEIFRLRFFAGLSAVETAESLGDSERTVVRHWTFARAWILDAIKGDRDG